MTWRRCDPFSTGPVSYDLTNFTAEIACTLMLLYENRPYVFIIAASPAVYFKFLLNIFNGYFRLHIEGEACYYGV